MGWSYRYKADDQLYADDEHGPTVFDPGAPISGGSGNVVVVGIPLLGQIGVWTDPTHIAGSTVIPISAHPALTGDVTGAAGSTVTAYANPMPASKGGLPTGGAPGQILVKNTGANFDTGWATGGGNVSNVATPTVGQLALWTDAFHVQGVSLLPAANQPALTGDVTLVAGTLVTAYGNPVPPAKAGLPLGGTTGQVLAKTDSTNFNTSWINPPVTGGNVSNSGVPQAGQIAIWTDNTHVQGVNTLPTTSAGTPPGGAAGEVLKKTTGTNFDYAWAPDISGSGGGTPGGTSGQLQYNVAGAFAGVQKVVMVMPGSGTLTAAAASAAAGTLLQLVPGDYVENTTTMVELPNDVHLKGAGMYLSRIISNKPGTSAPFHGIVAPGNNSVISDLSIIAQSPTGTGNEHVNSFSNRAGSTRSWTNVLVRNCYLTGKADVIINGGGASLGVMTFINCLLEGQNDIVMWQDTTDVTFINCEARHTVNTAADPTGGLSAIGFYHGDIGGTMRLYGCRFTYVGTNEGFGGIISIAGDGRVEAYDFVCDYTQQTGVGVPDDIAVWSSNAIFMHNVRRADGKALKFDTLAGPPTILDPSMSFTFAKLPLVPTYGQVSHVTNAVSGLANGAVVSAGGSTKYKVMWNGTAWIVLGGGTAGAGGGDLNYVHNQVSSSSSWSVVHNLAKFPSVSVVDSGGSLILPNITYVDANNLTITFGSSTSGKAYIN